MNHRDDEENTEESDVSEDYDASLQSNSSEELVQNEKLNGFLKPKYNTDCRKAKHSRK